MSTSITIASVSMAVLGTLLHHVFQKEISHINLLAYSSSKTALNAVTVQFAKELRDTPIKVNAADPGYTATDLNQYQGTRSVEQGARSAVRLATLPEDGPTGGFFAEEGRLPR